MNNVFVILAVSAIILAVILYIIYRKRLNEACHTASVVLILMALLFAFCRFLDFDSLNKTSGETYWSATTYVSKAEYQSGRPTMKQTTTISTMQNNSERVVYITRNGEKYHYNVNCGKNEYYKCTVQQAVDRGLEPCKKCID